MGWYLVGSFSVDDEKQTQPKPQQRSEITETAPSKVSSILDASDTRKRWKDPSSASTTMIHTELACFHEATGKWTPNCPGFKPTRMNQRHYKRAAN
mmetsp:Transcript_2342/g.4749  ORF Transcript_2342/g.4749 Transcript_2342/m.4749 type:complete len:96 (+) Transcript_2342:462-749(+)